MTAEGPPPNPDEQGEMLVNRVRKNRRRLKSWLKKSGVTCYRLYDRDIPELPLSIDLYERRLRVAETRRKGKEPVGRAWMEAVVAPVAVELGVAPHHVYYKLRQRQRGESQYQARGRDYHRFEVEESGHHFLVNLEDYLDTGLFLDHRSTRALVAEACVNKSLLNLFCYTGSFQVYAGRAGAATSLGIDLSATYLSWARDNFEINNLSQNQHRLRRGDVMEELEELGRGGERFDVAVVDPPTFSNSKRMEGVFDVQRDHVELLRAVHRVLASGGQVMFSTNNRRFQLAEPELESLFSVENISEKTRSPDFRDERIHQAFWLKRR